MYLVINDAKGGGVTRALMDAVIAKYNLKLIMKLKLVAGEL
jgi:hypothetical protein